MKNERMEIIMKLSWGSAKKLAKEKGGKPIDYIKDMMRSAHHDIKNNVYVLLYNKKEDDYINTHVIIGVNPSEKLNKKGDKYLSFVSFKGLRNYSFYKLIKCTDFNDAESKVIKLLKENPSYILSKQNSLN